MKTIALDKYWRNNKWHDIFKADNEMSFDKEDNYLLDDFCEYCNYKIEQQISERNIIISGPVRIFRKDFNISLDITSDNNVIRATYSLFFISLVVTFTEKDNNIVIDSDLQGKNFLQRFLYGPLANQFVTEGAFALDAFMKDLVIVK